MFSRGSAYSCYYTPTWNDAKQYEISLYRLKCQTHLTLSTFVYTQVKHGVGVKEIVDHVLGAWEAATGKKRR